MAEPRAVLKFDFANKPQPQGQFRRRSQNRVLLSTVVLPRRSQIRCPLYPQSGHWPTLSGHPRATSCPLQRKGEWLVSRAKILSPHVATAGRSRFHVRASPRLFTKNAPPVLLAHFIRDAGPRELRQSEEYRVVSSKLAPLFLNRLRSNTMVKLHIAGLPLDFAGPHDPLRLVH